MIVLLCFSFLAGLATILAPCIWPLLPIVLSASSAGGKRRPLGFALGVMTSFLLFTLFVSYLESILHINPNAFRFVAVIVIVLLGLSMLIPALGARFEVLIGRLMQPFQSRFQDKEEGTGFAGGYAAGFSIGLVWAPCAGPILAAIATLAATQAVDLRVFLLTLSYVLGLGIPLFAISLGGSWCFTRMRGVTKYTGRIQQAFGLIMICAAILIYTNYDKTLQLKVLSVFPTYGNLITGIEDNKIVGDRLNRLRGGGAPQAAGEKNKLADLGPAPEFKGISLWLNTAPLRMAQLSGKVVLVDFWTYSCINCLRTLPYTKAWYKQYGSDHFVLIGVHTPEFAFEKETSNVRRALRQFGIEYPVAQDNEFKTWEAFHNSYWPAEYLIDARGRIRLAHFGEGHYDEMDAAIRRLLAEAGHPVDQAAAIVIPTASGYDQTPETYLGLSRLERFGSYESPGPGRRLYSLPTLLHQDYVAYEGIWTLSGEAARPRKGSALEIQFAADQVYLVMGPHKKGDRIALSMDAEPIGAAAGSDVKNGQTVLDAERLYRLVDLRGKPGSHRLRIEFLDDGIAVYAFTFG